MKNSDNELYS